MEEDDAEDGHFAARGEDAHGHDGVFGDAPLPDAEEDPDEDAEDDEAEDFGGIPGGLHTPELHAEQEHERAADDGDRADPVDGLQALHERRARRLDVEEDD